MQNLKEILGSKPFPHWSNCFLRYSKKAQRNLQHYYTIDVAMSLFRIAKFIEQWKFVFNCEVFIRVTNCSNFHWSIASCINKRQTTLHSRFYNFYGTLKIFIVLNSPHQLVFIIIILVIAGDPKFSYHEVA